MSLEMVALALDFPKILDDEFKQAEHLQQCLDKDRADKVAKIKQEEANVCF